MSNKLSSVATARAAKIADKQLLAFVKEQAAKKDPFLNCLQFLRDGNNILKIKFIIRCPHDSYWHDQVLTGDIDMPQDYPFSPPVVHFTCNLYHPNIYQDGKVCISILNNKQDEFKYYAVTELWSPAIDITTIIISIWNLLLEPNIESPANVDAMKDYRDNLELFTQKTREKLVFDKTLLESQTKQNEEPL